MDSANSRFEVKIKVYTMNSFEIKMSPFCCACEPYNHVQACVNDKKPKAALSVLNVAAMLA